MAEKINKNERKGKSDIITEMMGTETEDFWNCLGVDESKRPITPTVGILFLYIFLISAYRLIN